MPLPNEPVKVTGGCSCGAVRYRINVPALEDRPLNPFAPPAFGIKLPGAITCHCNDCRRSTGSFLATGILDIPAPMLTVSAMSPSSESDIISGRILDVLADDYDAEKADADRPPRNQNVAALLPLRQMQSRCIPKLLRSLRNAAVLPLQTGTRILR
ncbi:hypothetical protein FOXB_00287 [Fusarium oxysporum f. sp. conglutinans Fo5176]|uniref:CENP-V/GFA domain-containing protein n=1 Tax=Fusarium oxysporum (strain Fo5176) TaxID=660025 RepID=F9F1L3_FUSOF|nr:hypothetical protein FOXB_00287 [Fusarium oxysporum f. sp. conglutinans Fo5176]